MSTTSHSAESQPQREPLSPAGQAYADEIMRLGQGIDGEAFHYGEHPAQSGLIFRPLQPTGPVLVFMHGGGWTHGDSQWMRFMAPAFTHAGICFVSLGYRLAPETLFPAGIQDAARGLRWVHQHLAPSRAGVFVGGHSAGGHYAALLSVTSRWLAEQQLPPDCIAGCLPISGVYDLTETSGLAIRPRFLGAAGNERLASPMHNLAAAAPPFLLAHGSRDFPHLMRQSRDFGCALRAAGGMVEELVLPDADHFQASIGAGQEDGPWVRAALSFIARD